MARFQPDPVVDQGLPGQTVVDGEAAGLFAGHPDRIPEFHLRHLEFRAVGEHRRLRCGSFWGISAEIYEIEGFFQEDFLRARKGPAPAMQVECQFRALCDLDDGETGAGSEDCAGA